MASTTSAPLFPEAVWRWSRMKSRSFNPSVPSLSTGRSANSACAWRLIRASWIATWIGIASEPRAARTTLRRISAASVTETSVDGEARERGIDQPAAAAFAWEAGCELCATRPRRAPWRTAGRAGRRHDGGREFCEGCRPAQCKRRSLGRQGSAAGEKHFKSVRQVHAAGSSCGEAGKNRRAAICRADDGAERAEQVPTDTPM